jgi:probable phosphoglycerate mutase
MSALLLIRHGPTSWNAEGRIQGRTDVALGAAGVAEVMRWRLPDEYAGWRWFASPLLRVVETARLLGARRITFVPELVEMRWGDWEGKRLNEIRATDPAGSAEIEASGLDFRAPGGESPREVQARVAPWLQALVRANEPAIALSHKGVIRALYAEASGWPMLGKPPDRLDWSSAHLFTLGENGALAVTRLNIGLRGAAEPAPCPPQLF